MKLTKRGALRKHNNMWDKLALSGGDKNSLPEVDLPVGVCKFSGCFLCAYAGYKTTNGGLSNYECRRCPLLDLWIGKIKVWHGEARCLARGSPFWKWFKAHKNTTRQKYAKQIADLGRKALAREMQKG